MAKDGELKGVQLKINDMWDHIDPFLDAFPRSEKGYAGLGTLMKLTIAKMAEAALDATKEYTAKSVLKDLHELDKLNQHLTYYLDRAEKKKIISGRHADSTRDYITDIGRLTGGWIRTINESEKSKYAKK